MIYLNKNNLRVIAVLCAIFSLIVASDLARAESVLEFSVPASSGEMLEARANAAFNPQGNKVTYDRNLFYLNGKPVFIHAGEMQYYRTPETEWEDRILKAKNSGLNCISTYVNWGIVEPVEGVFNFAGRYDLHRFISLCRKHDMLVILRVGPIVNSELRNAGLPEWVRERLPGEYHSELYPTPEWYFNAVNIYYQQLANQVKEFFPSKGGNIVMVQIDNETHVSWIWGRKETRPAAQVTINRLQQLAKETGFEGPFSCTGWLGDLGVMAEGSLPLTGAYLLNEWSPFQPPMAFDVPFEVRPSHYFNHHQVTLKMCDYASAGNGWSSDDLFRVWLPRPLFLRNAYPADTWRLMYPEIKDDHCPTIPKATSVVGAKGQPRETNEDKQAKKGD